MLSLSLTNANGFMAEYWKLCSFSPLSVLAEGVQVPAPEKQKPSFVVQGNLT